MIEGLTTASNVSSEDHTNFFTSLSTMSPSEPSSAEYLGRDTVVEKPTGRTSEETGSAVGDEISNILAISDSVIEETTACDKDAIVKPRAKHIGLNQLAGQTINHLLNVSGFAAVSGGEGIGGEGGGSDGNGKNGKGDVIHVDLALHEATETNTGTGGSQRPDEEKPDPDETGVETTVCDPKLAAWARENSVDYIEPSGYESAHSKFVGGKFLRHVTRKSKIEAVKEQLGDDVTSIRFFQLNIKTALQRANRTLCSSDKASPEESDGVPRCSTRKQKRRFSSVLFSSYEMLKGAMPQSSRALIEEELEEIRGLIGKLRKTYSRELEGQIVDAASKLEGLLRYKMEAREGTYRSINLTPDSLMQLVDVSGLKELLLADENNLNTICDFGCGDGETLIQLAAQVPVVLDLKGEALTDVKIRELSLQTYQTENPTWWQGREIENVVRPQIQGWKKDVAAQVKTKFVGIDQATHFIERLRDRKGVGGIVADLCVPTEKFLEETGISPNSVKIGISSLTIDRARDVEQLLGNISCVMAEDGTLVLLTKSTHSSRTDNAAANGDSFSQIEYSGKNDLKAKNRIQLLDTLKPLLEKHGLKVVRVGRHHGKVISTDSSANNVQTYRLLAIVCKKMPVSPTPIPTSPSKRPPGPSSKPPSRPPSTPPENQD